MAKLEEIFQIIVAIIFLIIFGTAVISLIPITPGINGLLSFFGVIIIILIGVIGLINSLFERLTR